MNSKHNHKNTAPPEGRQWPGYLKHDDGFFAAKIQEMSDEFSQGPHSRSQRVSKILASLSEAMIEDDYTYFLIGESVSRLYIAFSKEWNEMYVKVGGQLGTGDLVEAKPDPEVLEKLSVYPPQAFNMLQYGVQGLKAIQQSGEITGAELERMALVTLFLQSIHQSLIMDSWFDRIETAFINPMPTPILN